MTMLNSENAYCLILAGGMGRRLWPCSRENCPKQFIDFFGTGRSQLQQTWERMQKIIDREHVFVNTNAAFADIVREQLPDLPERNLLAEPIHRNTAPSVGWACHRIQHLNPEANIIIVPSDQIIINEEQFAHDVAEGLDFVSQRNVILTMGIRPTRPEPGYGYIQVGDYSDTDNIYGVKSFIEKPDRSFATMFMNSGEWYWNTGMFISSARTIEECLKRILPSVLLSFNDGPQYSEEAEQRYIDENFSRYPNLSMDYAVLEKSDNVYVKKCSFGWADVGTWHGIYEALPKDEAQNVSIDSDVLFDGSRGNVVKLPEGKFAVINGLEGYIVAEKDNVLLICKKEDSSALVRKYVNDVKMSKGDSYV